MGSGQSIIKKDVTQLSNQEAEARGTTITLEQVKTKLLAVHPELKSTPNKLDEEARCLSNVDELVEKYFSHLLQRGECALRAVQQEQEYFQEGYRNEATRASSTDRMAAEIHQLKKLEVKLLLYDINDQSHIQQMATVFHSHFHKFEFGPFHAAIQIGDVLLDWGPTELIRPKCSKAPLHEEVPGQRTPVFVGNVHGASSDESDAVFADLPVRGGAEQTQQGFKKTITKLKETCTEKEQLVRALAEVVVFYNTKLQYGLLSNNCHHFVLDVLNALCITDHKEVFQGRIKAHADILTARDQQKKQIVEYNSHQELDTYVRDNIDQMPRDELEFAYCHYLLFHMWVKKFPKERAWACNGDSCMCDELYARLERRV